MELPETLQGLHGLFMIGSFVLGTVVGSFCNVCISRWPSGESVIQPRSRCPKCQNSIVWYDNVPLISWLALGAKCRHCGQPISVKYPLVEALTGLLFLLVYWRFGLALATPIYMLFGAALIIVTFQDLADWTIPNEITFPGIPLGILLALAGMGLGANTGLRVTDVFDALLGAALGGGILIAMDRITVWVLKKPGMGFGDVKLLAMVGAFLGWRGALGALVIASMVGSVVGLGMLLYFRLRGSDATAAPEPAGEPEADKSPSTSDDEITLEGHYLPFGPYLALGALIFMFIGPEIIEAYFSMLAPSMEPVYFFNDIDMVPR